MGKRARIPTQKVLMAKKAQVMKGNSQRGWKPESSSKAADSGIKSVESKGVEELRQLCPDPVSVQLKNKAKVTTEMLIENMQEQPNGTVPCNQEALKQQQAKFLEIWNEIAQTSWGWS
ncbi:hypothetical protein R3W88_016737 [Solanum pinnatisectum]|uniref:Uncharacterized protein n=1 Tax=Solanum pinnatisectum TaxID=50273 RepID=A0AAV9L0P2_9SOLN|nr:hypothetical protein R3W88_016737 [Solanum pinnatisectum]